MAGSVLIGETIPRRRAVAATLSRPTSSASRAATVFTDWARAVSRVMGPRNPSVWLRGDQPPMVTGSSTSTVSGVRPASMAVR